MPPSRSNKKNPIQALRRSSSSPFKSSQLKKPGKASPSKQASKPQWQDSDDEESKTSGWTKLEDHGLVTALETDCNFGDVVQYLLWIEKHMFESLPERSGLNSARTAETLNYRKNLPPIVTLAHVHALSTSPTKTERDIADLVRSGVLRKISIPGRGVGSQALGDSVVLTERWLRAVRDCAGLADAAKENYITVMRSNPNNFSVPASSFTPANASALVRAGFLTAATHFNAGALMRPDTATIGSLVSLSSSGSRAAAGSTAAVGGENAVLDAGGGGGGLSYANADHIASASHSDHFTFSLPSIGPYLRLVHAARTHLVHLLQRSRYNEAPVDLLRERWNGGVGSHASARPSDGLAGSVLPAKTKKWKQFHGLSFQWVLEECLGTGLIEVFKTGSVGLGARLSR